MKILIDNRTNLSNESIGIILDDIQEREKNSTQYIGKWKGYEFEMNTGWFHIETQLMKRYFKVVITEV